MDKQHLADKMFFQITLQGKMAAIQEAYRQ